MNDVKSAKRILEILRFFAAAKKPASLACISGALGFPKSSCLALMETLVSEGYAYQSDGRYYLTGRWLREAEIVSRHDRVALRCRTALQGLSEELRETVILAKLAHDKVVYLDVIEADHVVRFSAYVGQQKPVHAAASGRALLSVLPDEDLRVMAGSLTYPGFTSATPRSAKAMLLAVRAGQQRGWHLNLGEHEADTISVAAPFLLDGSALALVVGGPASRLKEKVDTVGAALKRAASGLNAMTNPEGERHAWPVF